MRRLPRDLIAFASLIWQDWKALMGGLATVVLGALGVGYSGWPFWVAAMICLLLTAFRVWQREHREKEQLAGRLAGDELAAQRRARVMQLTEGFGPAEKAALRYMLRIGPVSDFGIQSELERQGLPHADLTRLAEIGVIWREAAGAGWSVAPEYAEPLRSKLGKG